MAQRLTFDKKSGLPQSVHQYMQIGDEMELYAMVKAKGADVPDLIGEYLQMESIKLRNKLNIEHKVSNTSYMWPLPQDPFKTPSTKELNLQLDQYLDSLQQHSTPLDGVTFVYMDESSDQPFSPPLQGAYVQTGAVSVVSEKGDTLSLTSRLWNTATGYYPLSHLGPYHADLYSPQPNVKAYHVDLTVHIATQTEKITLTDRRNTQGKFSMEVNDSTFTLTYQHDRIKLYEPYPMHSITCYDRNGKIVTARPLTTIYRSQIKETALYTPLELAEIYSNLDERRYSGSVSYIFEAKDVNKVVLEAYTNTIPITKTFSSHNTIH